MVCSVQLLAGGTVMSWGGAHGDTGGRVLSAGIGEDHKQRLRDLTHDSHQRRLCETAATATPPH